MVLGKLGQCRPVYGDCDCGVGVADREGLGLDMVQREFGSAGGQWAAHRSEDLTRFCGARGSGADWPLVVQGRQNRTPRKSEVLARAAS